MDTFKLVIESYNSIDILSKDEIKLIYAILSFPRDFTTISRDYYYKQKSWSYEVFLNRLKDKINNDIYREEFINKLKIENPILIGHSNGGKTIINYAGRKLGKINKIVLIDSTGIKPKRKPSYYFKVYTFKTVKNIVKILPKKFEGLREKALSKFGSADYKSSPEVLRKTMNIILNEDQRKIMPNINVPTLMIWGDKDTATPLRDAKKMEEFIPNSGIAVLEGAGHFSYLDRLNQCLLILDEFLKNDKK